MIFYILYDDNAGKFTQKGCSPAAMIPNITGLTFVEITENEYRDINISDFEFDPVTRQKALKVDVDQIRDQRKKGEQSSILTAIRDDLEQSPVVISGAPFQVRETPDIVRMRSTERDWDYITLTKDAEGRILWKDDNNDLHPMTREEFSEFVETALRARTERGDRLFAYSEFVKSQLPLPNDHPAFNKSNWPG